MDKNEVIKHYTALKRYNQWEKKSLLVLDPIKRISIVFDLYDFIPPNYRQRKLDVSGIIKMRHALSALT